MHIDPVLAASTFALEFYILMIVFALVIIVMLTIIGQFISLWFQAFVSGTPISLMNIIGMKLRKIPPHVIVNARINSFKAGLKMITVSDLETHYLAGGRVLDVVAAMIAADKANISLDWRQSTAIDLAGRSILDAVKTSVYPKVIDCPTPHSTDHIVAVARDGVELLCRARVTVRTNIQQLVGGATEDTVIARVGEGIVSAIGSAESHLEVLESPQRISSLVLEKGLDAQTAFEILSIDIADISVRDNIGAKLRADRAEADMRIFRADAEKRRAMAVAEEQENVAKVQAMRAKVVEAEACVPLAIAEAFKNGRIGVFDYARLQNIQSDTEMRSTLSQPEKKKDPND